MTAASPTGRWWSAPAEGASRDDLIAQWVTANVTEGNTKVVKTEIQGWAQELSQHAWVTDYYGAAAANISARNVKSIIADDNALDALADLIDTYLGPLGVMSATMGGAIITDNRPGISKASRKTLEGQMRDRIPRAVRIGLVPQISTQAGADQLLSDETARQAGVVAGHRALAQKFEDFARTYTPPEPEELHQRPSPTPIEVQRENEYLQRARGAFAEAGRAWNDEHEVLLKAATSLRETWGGVNPETASAPAKDQRKQIDALARFWVLENQDNKRVREHLGEAYRGALGILLNAAARGVEVTTVNAAMWQGVVWAEKSAKTKEAREAGRRSDAGLENLAADEFDVGDDLEERGDL